MNNLTKDNMLRAFLTVLWVVIVLGFIPYSVGYMGQEHHRFSLGDQITFQMNSEEAKVVNMSEYSFSMPKKGDVIKLMKTVKPSDLENIVQPVLVMDGYHCIIDVYLNGKHYYNYGDEIAEKGRAIGHEYLRVPLPENGTYSRITIKLTVTENNGFSAIDNYYIIPSGESCTSVLAEHCLTLMTSMTLIVVGLVGIVVSVSRKKYKKEVRTLTWMSWFAVGVSMWMLCNDKIIFFLVNNNVLASYLEYFSLYMTAIPVMFYFANLQQNETMRKVFIGGGIGVLGWNVIILALDFTHVIPYVFWVPYMQIAVVLCVGVILLSLFYGFKNKTNNQKILAYGMVFLGGVVAVELLRFNAYKYLVAWHIFSVSFLPMGTFVFVVAMAYSYFMEYVKSCYSKAEESVLKRMAFTDLLTNVYNRNKCEEILSQMEEEGKDCYVVTCDLNGLKYVNDNYGHNKGDELLINFSEILREDFTGIGYFGRMGGDEFMILLPEIDEKKVEVLLGQMDKHIDEWNKTHKEFEISVAYGYAIYDNDKQEPIRKAYECADKKMYANKRKIKEQLRRENV